MHTWTFHELTYYIGLFDFHTLPNSNTPISLYITVTPISPPYYYFQSNITVYTYHTTGTHQPSFIVSTACQTITDLSATTVGMDHLLVYVCGGPVNRMEARLVHLEDLMEGKRVMQCLAWG